MSSNDPPLTPDANDDDADQPSWEPTSELPVVPADAPLPEQAPAEESADASLTDLSLTQQLVRRRVSHRRYVMRRVMVAGALVLLMGAAVFGIVMVATGDDGDETAATTPDTSEVSEPAALPTSTKPRPSSTAARTTSTTDAPVVAAVTEPAAGTETTEPQATDPEPTEPATMAASEDEPERTEAAAVGTEPDETEPDETEPDETEPEITEPTESSAPATTGADEISYDLLLEPTCEMQGGAKVDQAGDDVECLEERLMQITDDALDLDVDRTFDEDTDAAVRAFQEHFDLDVDGIVGPETASKLGIWPGSWPPDTTPDTTDNED